MGHKGEVGFDPTRESVTACLENTFLLANKNDHKNMAIPFIACAIFKDRIIPPINKADLAKIIVKACQTYH